MKILVHGLSSGIGGVESFLFNYCSVIERIHPGISFDYIVYDQIPEYAESVGLKKDALHVVPSREASLKGNRDGLRELLGQGEYDCVWVNGCSLSDIGPLSQAQGSVPLRVMHAHSSQNMGGLVTGLLHGLHKMQIDAVATDLLACSSEAAAFMFPVKDVDAGSVKLVSNGIDVSRFAFDEADRKRIRSEHGWVNERVIIYVGRMSPEKNPLFVLEVARSLRDRGEDVRLVMLGDGPQMPEVKDAVERFAMDGYVDLMGSVLDVAPYLSAADVFLMPSLFEGLGIALVEAQAAGLQCFASTGVPQAALCAPNARRLPLESADEWAQAIIAADSKERNRSEFADVVRQAGFDIESNARDLGAWFLQRAEEASSS